MRKVFVDRLGATFLIGSDPRNATLMGFAGTGGLGIPKFYLIDARGKVVSDGIPSEAQIENLLAEVVERKLARQLHPSLLGATALYRSGFLGGAYKLARSHGAAKDSKLVADAKYLRRQIKRVEAFELRNARKDMLEAKPSMRYGSFLCWKFEYAGLPMGGWAAGELAKIKNNRKLWASGLLKRDRAVWRKLEDALKRETKSGSGYHRKRARQLYVEIKGKHRRSAVARFADRRLQMLDSAAAR